jgi:hypothetical protein
MEKAMGLWSESVNEWFDQGYIGSARILSNNEVLVFPGKIENFGFHFSRDLIPVDGGLSCKVDKHGNYIVSFTEKVKLSECASEVFETLQKRSMP